MNPWDEQLERILRSWRVPPTRYIDGQCLKGVGVDCVRFVDAVLQELYGWKLKPLPLLPPDTSAHSAKAVMRIGLLIARRFPNTEFKPPFLDHLESGDIVVAAWGNRENEGHVFIIGPNNKPWHAIQESGVTPTHFSHHWNLMRMWRPNDKESWA